MFNRPKGQRDRVLTSEPSHPGVLWLTPFEHITLAPTVTFTWGIYKVESSMALGPPISVSPVQGRMSFSVSYTAGLQQHPQHRWWSRCLSFLFCPLWSTPESFWMVSSWPMAPGVLGDFAAVDPGAHQHRSSVFCLYDVLSRQIYRMRDHLGYKEGKHVI